MKGVFDPDEYGHWCTPMPFWRQNKPERPENDRNSKSGPCSGSPVMEVVVSAIRKFVALPFGPDLEAGCGGI